MATDFTIQRSNTVRLTKPQVDLVRNPPAPSLEELLWQPFRDHVARLSGAPGEPVSAIESAGAGTRVRYQDGVIYKRADGGTAWVHGVIGDRYEQLGGASSWLGMPLTDEMAFGDDGGRVSAFERGAIYFWGDVGAIELNDIVVQYTGLMCFGETDQDQSSDSDEPYVVLGVTSPSTTSESRSKIYEDVDAGESRPDFLEIFRGKPSGLSLAVVLMEHDLGDPDAYKAEVTKFVDESFNAAAAAATQVPYVGPVLAAIVPILKKPTADFLNATLGTGDDHLGSAVITLTPKQLVVLAARTPTSSFKGLTYKVETPVLGSSEGATYKIYVTLGTA
ncbi:hypothetical protein E3O62_05875 [Cryobacterium sp. TMT2-15-1]|uniref:LGFP repeat-containing protein n=1 Tax=Cryobacterium sp. TMT2-15-1 TaxID=1259246 RepID=UPI00106B50B5|nr:hypothetical protein [Cryobacterium sp. TMT2-15-1]TFC61192.1 hypothetical protein E3O62_05875 [Cryobacterium sp. TMT2-15-1]